MGRILINDGINEKAVLLLEEHGHQVNTNRIPQEELMEMLPAYDAICVRSATKVRKELIENCPNLKVIGRGGVGLDNIDVSFAKSKGIAVINTPAASSRSVAELTLGHLLSLVRSLHKSNRTMPLEGNNNFKALKKSYSKGVELKDKTIGIIGFGRIGQEMAKLCLGTGMKVIYFDPMVEETSLSLKILDQDISIQLKRSNFENLLTESDIISCHTPSLDKPVINDSEIEKMKDGVILLNASRGNIIDENALMKALDTGKVFGAGLDVFSNEPNPDPRILKQQNISLSPHIGASTLEAQENIGLELAQQLIEILKN